MTKGRWLAWLTLAVFLLAGPASPVWAAAGDKIVRTKNANGLPVITSVCQLLGCSVLGPLDVVPGSTQQSSLFLVRGLINDVVTLLLSVLGLESIEPDLPVSLGQSASLTQASVALLDQQRTPMSYYGTVAWEAYFTQPAADIVGVRNAHCSLGATGGGIVAVIDSGVDPNHPALQAVLTAGYDFTRNAAGGSEMTDWKQASAGSPTQVYQVNQASVAVLDQASVAVLDSTAYADFGHGTMVAGIVHLVAPTAKIMPLKAFGANGQGYTSDVLRAIYYATLKGAKVINMSFSSPKYSPEMGRAISNATAKGLIAVAAAGNNGNTALVYPAATPYVMGIASTTDYDSRSSFSNYGNQLVWVAAPGEGIISTYPFGSYAAGWGTSFSAPFVSGAAALIVGMKSSANYSQASSSIADAVPLTSDLHYGRLDLARAISAAHSLWSITNTSPTPATCPAQGIDWSPAP